MAHSYPDEISINTLLGPGSSIRGDVKVNGFIRVDGDIDGSLETAGRVIIGEDARVRGSVRSRSITIGGIIQGDVIAPDRVVVLASGIVLGAILTRKLEVEESVLLNGPCFAIDDEQRFNQALVDYQNRIALREGSLAGSRPVSTASGQW